MVTTQSQPAKIERNSAAICSASAKVAAVAVMCSPWLPADNKHGVSGGASIINTGLTKIYPVFIIPAMKDIDAIEFLVEKLGNNIALAAALDVHPAVITNWKARGISVNKRAALWMMVNDHGGNLPREWLTQRKETAPQPVENKDQNAA